MTIKQYHILKTVLAIAFASCLGFFFALYTHDTQSFNVFANTPKTQEYGITPTRVLSKPTTASQISPDGTKQIIMKAMDNADGSKAYFFSTADSAGNNAQMIFSKTLDYSKAFTIPFNAWSPDNKYFFIQEQTTDGSTTDIIALNASNRLFPNEKPHIEVMKIFKERNTGNYFKEATGWASETLIIINTSTPDNMKGPSYWFEIPSTAIIQLATEF